MITLEQLQIEPEKIEKKIKELIANRLKSARLEGAVVAVSGGIDSAVALTASVRVFGVEKVRRSPFRSVISRQMAT